METRQKYFVDEARLKNGCVFLAIFIHFSSNFIRVQQKAGFL